MPASPIRKLAPLADAAKQRGIHVFHLNIGQPDLPTPQAAIDAIRNIDRKVLEYSPSAGYRSYREKLVGYYEKFNINLTADDIIITTGGSEAVLFSFMSCLNPGDEIIVPEPAYANYMAFAISAGAKIRTIATTIEEGFSLPKVEKFEELINERTKGILICNPNNPTGYLYTRREMNQIRDLVKKYDLFLFSDEVYREFIYTGSPYISACHLEGIENNVVLIDSVSKRYSECGIRIGALITKNKEDMHLSHLKKEGKAKYALLVATTIGAVIGCNLLFELLGVTNKSEAYTEVAAQQYSAHFIVGILVFGFISPIAEEILFRGVIYGYLRRFMDIKLAIVLSALIFGVYHMNYVQGVYGFLIGCLMAYAYEYFGEFKMAVFVHVASNVLAYCLSYTAIAVTGFVSWPVCVIFLAVAVVSLGMLHKQKNIF
mgnify:CR=1 FL=1